MRLVTILRGAIIVLFFLSTLWLVAGLPVIFNSPDENANFVFAQTFSETGRFKIFELANRDLGGLLGPRSAVAIDNTLVPKSFFGFPLIASVVSFIFNPSAMLYLTPVLAVLVVLAWRSLLHKVFDDNRLADLTALFLLIHPAFWYYTGRTMMHNVAFLAFLIFGAWFFVVRPWQKLFSNSVLDALFAGLMIGFAIATRTSEVIWVMALTIFLFWYARSTIKRRQVAIFFVALALTLVPFALINESHYGNFWLTGYTVPEAASDLPLAVQIPPEQIDQADFPGALTGGLGYIFPFGFHEMNIIHNVWNYGFLLYPWMSGLALLGITLAFIKRKRPWIMLSSVTIILGAWLGIVYGSWWFTDNPDPTIVSLGNSHVRYWLPLFLLASLFTAQSVIWIGNHIRYRALQTSVVLVIATGMIALSGWLVFLGQDGFVQTRDNLIIFDEKRQAVLASTEEDAIIVVDRADKFLFPDRRVVVPLRSERTYGSMPAMLEVAPLYYFGLTLPEEDLAFLNDFKLAEMDLRIEPIEIVFDETLYQITPIE
ncbi:hypothetical protein IH979_02840 [Patescibacteria group bacterium]|nr:hypothetical protein [Patescibacteria group bacterium]